MKIKNLWMSRDSGGKSRFGLRSLGGVLGIVALALLLAGGGTVLMLRRGLPVQGLGLMLCLLVTALAMTLALRLGRRTVQDATVFFLTEDDRLFILDARELVDYGRNTVDNVLGAFKTQQLLRELAQRRELPGRAREIVKVEKLKDRGSSLSALCLVRDINGRPFRLSCFLVRGMENEEELIRQLERRRNWRDTLEERDSRRPLYILLSAACLAAFTALCVLSHPAVSRLPQGLYFPCLLGAFAAVCFLAWFAVRQRRGE